MSRRGRTVRRGHHRAHRRSDHERVRPRSQAGGGGAELRWTGVLLVTMSATGRQGFAGEFGPGVSKPYCNYVPRPTLLVAGSLKPPGFTLAFHGPRFAGNRDNDTSGRQLIGWDAIAWPLQQSPFLWSSVAAGASCAVSKRRSDNARRSLSSDTGLIRWVSKPAVSERR